MKSGDELSGSKNRMEDYYKSEHDSEPHGGLL